MTAILRKKADVSVAIAGMLNNLADFEVRKFVAPGDVLTATGRQPTEHLDIFFKSIVKIVSKGVASTCGKDRIATLKKDSLVGWDVLRQHCIECRSLM